MATWQVVLFGFFVLLPFALLADFWPDHERLDYRGHPMTREWHPQVPRERGTDDAAHDGD